MLPAFPRESLREASKERVARKSFEERAVHVVSDGHANSCPNGNANQKAHHQHEGERQDILGRQPGRE
jgi:hypothetical protein